MLKQERLQQIEEELKTRGFVSMEELCQNYSVSINTARADVRELISRGVAQKTYGGVSSVLPGTPAGDPAAFLPEAGSFEVREQENLQEKQAIARAAASLIRAGDIIYLDLGTTCLPILDFVPKDLSATVITNDLSIINKATDHRSLRIMTFGGTYQRVSNSFKSTYPAMLSYINACNFSKAFLGTVGISPRGSVTTSENFGKEIRSQLLKECPSCYLVADSSKFGKTALLTYGQLSAFTAVITDSGISEEYRELIALQETSLITAEPSKA